MSLGSRIVGAHARFLSVPGGGGRMLLMVLDNNDAEQALQLHVGDRMSVCIRDVNPADVSSLQWKGEVALQTIQEQFTRRIPYANMGQALSEQHTQTMVTRLLVVVLVVMVVLASPPVRVLHSTSRIFYNGLATAKAPPQPQRTPLAPLTPQADLDRPYRVNVPEPYRLIITFIYAHKNDEV